MNVYDYPKEMNMALNYKQEGKTFEQYEAYAQNHLQPIECQIFWLLAEDVMDIVAEETNKETAELAKLLGEKDREINKLKKKIDKMNGNFDVSDEGFGFKAIGRVLVNVSNDSGTHDITTANTYDIKSSTVSGRGLATSIEKSQALGNWFIVKDLDTGSKKAYRLNNINGYTELRYPMVTETSPIPEDLPKKFDPDKRVKKCEPSITEICGYSDAHFNGEYHGEEPDSSNYGDNGGGF